MMDACVSDVDENIEKTKTKWTPILMESYFIRQSFLKWIVWSSPIMKKIL